MALTVEDLPISKQIYYAIGQLGWSTLVNIVGVALVFFYLPPDTAGLPQLITGATFFGVLNAITLIAASGRLLDAITDPWIAGMSDRSTNPKGRRVPFMARGAIPAAVFLVLIAAITNGAVQARTRSSNITLRWSGPSGPCRSSAGLSPYGSARIRATSRSARASLTTLSRLAIVPPLAAPRMALTSIAIDVQ